MPPHLKQKLQVSLVRKQTKERKPQVTSSNDLYKSMSRSFGQDFPMWVRPSSLILKQIPIFRLERLLHLARAFNPAQKNIHSQLYVDLTKKSMSIASSASTCIIQITVSKVQLFQVRTVLPDQLECST